MKTLILICLLFLTACTGLPVKECPEEYLEELTSFTDHNGNTMRLFDIDCDLTCDAGVLELTEGASLLLPCDVAYEIIEEYKEQFQTKMKRPSL